MGKVKNKSKDVRLECATHMPALYNKLPDEEYSVEKSEVIQWLIKQPKLVEYLFSVVSRSGFITYDSNTKKWQGVEWEGDDV